METLKTEIAKLKISSGKTGIIYDPRTLLHKTTKDHYENPSRVTSILDRLKS